jgi:hypothetical protein
MRPVQTTTLAILVATLFLPLSPAGFSAQQDDLSTVDGVITALYASISGPVGQERDRDRFEALFAPDAKLIPTNSSAPGGYIYLTPETYWDRSAEMLTRIGFTEAEVARTTETFGNITHVFSTYESYRGDEGDPDTPFARGINSIQLVWYQDRYWVLSVFWDSERPDNPIPRRYLGG